MEDHNVPIYYVDDIEDDEYDRSSVYSSTSAFTEHSMSTLTSSEVSEYFQEIHGRMFPLDQNAPRLFPTDQLEVRRLDIQHATVKLALNGNYYGPVQDVLAETSERRKRVLDLFTAEGNWVREMANNFPHVDFISVDTIPLVPHIPCVNILGYEVYDVYNGIAELDESFDLVHMRHVVSKVKSVDVASLIVEVHRVLRPGGLFIFGEFQSSAFDASTADHSTTHTAPKLTRAMELINYTSVAHGAAFYAWRDVPLMLDPECNLWRQIAEEERRGFRHIRRIVKDFPTRAWHPTPRLRDVGTLTALGTPQTWSNLEPMFISQGLTESEANELLREVHAELVEPGPRKLYFKYHLLYAFKPT